MSKFYDGSELLSHSNYDIFFSLGGRFIGKSTFFQRYGIRHFIKYGEKFGIIVKYQDDFKTFAKNYYSEEWMNQWYPDYEILFKMDTYYIKKKNEEEWRLCGYAIALNKNAAVKSTTTYHDVINLIFEEFIPLEDRYIGNASDPEKEPKLLTSIYQTIARGQKGKHTRRVRLFCISNNYTMNNPYFTRFGILNMVTNNPNSVYQRFYKYDKKNLHYVLEFSQIDPGSVGIEADEEDSGKLFIDFRNELKLVNKTQKLKNPDIVLTFDNKYIIGISRYNESLATYQIKKFDAENIPAFSCSNIRKADISHIKALKGTRTYQQIERLFNTNSMYYDKLESYIHLTNILAYC